MLKHYVIIAWRNLAKNPQFTLLNGLGLATGLACALLIFLWVADETGVAHFRKNDERRYQVMHNVSQGTGIQTIEQTPGLFSETMGAVIPETEYAVPVIPTNLYDKEGIISYQNNRFSTNRIMAGRNFFHVFPFPLLQGNTDHALDNLYSVAISRDLAMRLFNTTENCIGRSIAWDQLNYKGAYIVSAIYDIPAAYAGDAFDLIFPYGLFIDRNKQKASNWENNDASTYVLLKPGSQVTAVNDKMDALIKNRTGKTTDHFFLQRYADSYLYNHYENGRPDGGRIAYVTLFSLIGIFILAIACINFMNLSTARAAGRVAEVGIRKTMGANRAALIGQYLGESLLLTGISLLVAFLMVWCILPSFNNLTGKHLSLFPLWKILLSLGTIGLFTGLVAGSYPALHLSGFKPVTALKGKLARSAGELFVRKGLVTLQFVLSLVFMVSLLVIYKQVHYIQTKNLGYNREHIILFEKKGLLSDSSGYYTDGGGYVTELSTFMQGLRQIPGVISAANYRHDIINRQGGTSDVSWEGKATSSNVDFTDLAAGYGFIETLGIEMAAGRSFSPDYGTEKSKVIFNEAAIASMGIKDPIGKTVKIWGEQKQIIGVAKNFNFQSLHDNIRPCFFDFNFNHRASNIMVRLQAGSEGETIEKIRAFYKANDNGLALDFRFLDDDYQKLYASENRVAVLSVYFTAISILITCLGLFGLAAYTAHSRRKEMSIRKIVGATVTDLTLLLSKDFLQLLCLAFLVAFPISWWLMDHWLHAFAYRVAIGAGIFATTAASTLLITVLTTGYQSVKGALASPVKSLRNS